MNSLFIDHDLRAPSDKKDTRTAKPTVKTDHRAKIKADRGNIILCRNCLHVITHRSQQISVDGAHEHTFANPHGIVFEIGCFKSALGCGYVGQPTDEFSWFKGYMWRVALCGSCLIHMGWLFSSLNLGDFIGLIMDRLIETDQ